MPGSLVGDVIADAREQMNTPTPAAQPDALRAGVRVSVASVAWTVATSATAVAVAILDGTLVLLVFGVTGLLDAVGSAALALHFRHALAHEAMSERRERLALRIVSGGLIAIGVSTVVESTRRLVVGSATHGSPAGIAIASASVIVLAALAIAKRAVAARIRSRALRADGALSATGACLSAVTIAGIAAGETHAWVDAVAALLVAGVAAVVGFNELRHEEKELR